MASHSPSSPDISVTRLLSEAADLRRTIHSLELQLKDSRETSKALSAQVQRLKSRAEEADSQLRLSQNSVNLEETLRRRDSDADKLAEKCSRLERDLEQSEQDLKSCRKDLQSSQFALSEAQNDLLDLKTTIKDLEEERENSIKQAKKAICREKTLETSVSDLSSEVQSLQNKAQTLGEEKVRLEIDLLDLRRVQETANYVQKDKEREVNELKSALHSLESDLDKVQKAYNEDLIRLKSEAERRIEHQRGQYAEQEAVLRASHAEEIAVLQQHYEGVLNTLERTAKSTLGSERDQWWEEIKALRQENEAINASMRDSCLRNTEAEERVAAIRAETERDLEELRETLEGKMQAERCALRKEQRLAIDQVTSQLRMCENERDSQTSRLRKAENSLSLASDRLRIALQDNQSLNSQVQSLQDSLTQANSEVEEMTFSLADFKRENSDLQSLCSSLKGQLEERSAAGKKHRDRERRWKAESQRLGDLVDQLEKEKEVVMERERNWLETARRMRAEEEEKRSSQLKAQTSLETHNSTLQTALQTAQVRLNTQSAQLADLQDLNSSLQASLTQARAEHTALEERSGQLEKRYKEVKGKAKEAQRTVKEVVNRHFRIVKGVRQECVMRVALLRTAVSQELQAFQSTLSSVSTQCFFATDSHLASLNRGFQASSRDQQAQIEHLHQQLQTAVSDFKAYKAAAIAREKAANEEIKTIGEQARGEQEARKKSEKASEALKQELKVKEELTGKLAQDFAGIQFNVQRLKEENTAVRERSKAEATARIQALEAAYSSDLQRLQTAHQQNQTQNEATLTTLRSQLDALKAAQTQESEQMTALFQQKMTEKDAQIGILRETNKAETEEIACLRSELSALRKKTEGPLASLQAEIEALARGLRQEQSRCRLVLERKDRELENLRGELRQWQSRSTTL